LFGRHHTKRKPPAVTCRGFKLQQAEQSAWAGVVLSRVFIVVLDVLDVLDRLDGFDNLVRSTGIDVVGIKARRAGSGNGQVSRGCVNTGCSSSIGNNSTNIGGSATCVDHSRGGFFNNGSYLARSGSSRRTGNLRCVSRALCSGRAGNGTSRTLILTDRSSGQRGNSTGRQVRIVGQDGSNRSSQISGRSRRGTSAKLGLNSRHKNGVQCRIDLCLRCGRGINSAGCKLRGNLIFDALRIRGRSDLRWSQKIGQLIKVYSAI